MRIQRVVSSHRRARHLGTPDGSTPGTSASSTAARRSATCKCRRITRRAIPPRARRVQTPSRVDRPRRAAGSGAARSRCTQRARRSRTNSTARIARRRECEPSYGDRRAGTAASARRFRSCDRAQFAEQHLGGRRPVSGIAKKAARDRAARDPAAPRRTCTASEGASCATFSITIWRHVPANGGAPASISNSTAPIA